MYGGHFHIRWNNAITSKKKMSLCVSGNDNDDDGDDDIGDECLYISA
jgi:hypothetical protein